MTKYLVSSALLLVQSPYYQLPKILRFPLYRVRHLTLPILIWQQCLCGLWEGSLTTVVGFRVDLDSVNNGTLVRAAAHILCGTVRVKQVDRIRAARVSSETW